MPTPPVLSLLDPGQIIKYAYDEQTGRIKVDTTATVNVDGAIEVALDHNDDSVKVGNGSYFLNINSDGSINVNTTVGGTTNYAVQIDTTSTANVTYIGKATIGSTTSASLWQIQKINETSGLVITWANSSDSFTNIWNNRTSITYG